MPNPAPSLVERLADGIFKAVHAAEITHDKKARSIWRPVSPLHVFENLARSSACERSTRQSALRDPSANRFAVQQNCHLRCGRNRHQLSSAQTHGARFGSFGAGREHIHWIPLPSGAVENGLTIGCETGGPNTAAAKGELAVKRRLRGSWFECHLAGEKAETGSRKQAQGEHGCSGRFLLSERRCY